MNIENYYLDIQKLFELENRDKIDFINSFYMDFLNNSSDSSRSSVAISLLESLKRSGYLKSIREEKIEEIIGDKTINN